MTKDDMISAIEFTAFIVFAVGIMGLAVLGEWFITKDTKPEQQQEPQIEAIVKPLIPYANCLPADDETDNGITPEEPIDDWMVVDPPLIENLEGMEINSIPEECQWH